MDLRQETSDSWKVLFSENFLKICVSQTKFSFLPTFFFKVQTSALLKRHCMISHKELNYNNSHAIEISPNQISSSP